MEQVSRDAETSAEAFQPAVQPAVPQIASRVRHFNSEKKKTVVEKKKGKKEKKEKEKKERKEKKESRKTATVTSGDGRYGDL